MHRGVWMLAILAACSRPSTAPSASSSASSSSSSSSISSSSAGSGSGSNPAAPGSPGASNPTALTAATELLGADAGAQASNGPEALLYPARRCGECHGRQRAEWSSSAHAQAAQGAFALVSTRLGAESSQRCQGCHVPLAQAGERVASDGVACDACHTAVSAAPAPKMLTLAPERATRFGPFRDAKDHSFHRVAYSEFVTEGVVCEPCHQDPPGQPVPEYTTVAEWRASAERVDCPSCHMPGFQAEAAKGERVRPVSHHDFSPDKAKALAGALELTVKVSRGQTAIALENVGAHHALPTGRPERRLRLELTWIDANGHALSQQEHQFGRTLVDGSGALSPSFAAVRQQADDRLQAGATWRGTFAPVSGARKVAVRLYYDPFDRALAAYFGNTESTLVVERTEAL